MAHKRMSKREFLETEIVSQKLWIAGHGGSLRAYVERYGSADEPKHYGNGGEAIYKADTDALANLQARLAGMPQPRRTVAIPDWEAW
jgi:hypothetical protein